MTTQSYLYDQKDDLQVSLGAACDKAAELLTAQYQLDKVCVDILYKEYGDRWDMRTVSQKEFDEVVQRLIDDTLYWEGKWMGTN